MEPPKNESRSGMGLIVAKFAKLGRIFDVDL